MSERKVVHIRAEDDQLLDNLAAIEGRTKTEILHRALIGYLTALPGQTRKAVERLKK